jgi:predicted transposase
VSFLEQWSSAQSACFARVLLAGLYPVSLLLPRLRWTRHPNNVWCGVAAAVFLGRLTVGFGIESNSTTLRRKSSIGAYQRILRKESLLLRWEELRRKCKLAYVQKTVQVKLLPAHVQREALLKTMHQFDAARDWLSERVFELNVFSRFKLQALCYKDIRFAVRLSAQATCLVVRKVADAYAISRASRNFRPLRAITSVIPVS